MLADKSLEMMFPGVPKHPRQNIKYSKQMKIKINPNTKR